MPARGRIANPAIGIRIVRIKIVSGMFMEHLYGKTLLPVYTRLRQDSGGLSAF
jgi:hypothetical protein